MDELNPETLQAVVALAAADLESIKDMLRFIRDRVAPTIPEHDLQRFATRHSVRMRIAPHPTLRRATWAAEAACAAMRRVRSAAATARTLLQGQAALPNHEAIRAEAGYWAQLAQAQMQVLAQAKAAIAHDRDRVIAGTATVVAMPPPVLHGRPGS